MRGVEGLLCRGFGKNHRRCSGGIDRLLKPGNTALHFYVGCVRPRITDQCKVARVGFSEEGISVQPYRKTLKLGAVSAISSQNVRICSYRTEILHTHNGEVRRSSQMHAAPAAQCHV